MLRVAYCLSPYHLLEALSFYDPSGQMIILAKNGEHYAPLLAELSALTVLPIEERKNVLRELVERNEKFDFYFATLWNRTALLLERAALRSGGHVNIFDDGASGGFDPVRRTWRDWRYPVRWLAFALVDGTQYCDHQQEKRYDPARTTFHSIRPDLMPVPSKSVDLPALRGFLVRLKPHFDHLAEYRGLPVFFDTNDHDWYPFEQKVEILKSLLPNEPTIYLAHPDQRLSVVPHLPQLIDLTDKVHCWNELASFFIQPKAVYSTFSTCAFTLRHIFGLPFENHFMFEEFYRRTGSIGFVIKPTMRAYFEGM
jgi:hypothetical protein